MLQEQDITNFELIQFNGRLRWRNCKGHVEEIRVVLTKHAERRWKERISADDSYRTMKKIVKTSRLATSREKKLAWQFANYKEYFNRRKAPAYDPALLFLINDTAEMICTAAERAGVLVVISVYHMKELRTMHANKQAAWKWKKRSRMQKRVDELKRNDWC